MPIAYNLDMEQRFCGEFGISNDSGIDDLVPEREVILGSMGMITVPVIVPEADGEDPRGARDRQSVVGSFT